MILVFALALTILHFEASLTLQEGHRVAFQVGRLATQGSNGDSLDVWLVNEVTQSRDLGLFLEMRGHDQ